MNMSDLSWSFITGYYYPKFRVVIQNMEWDERYDFLKALYDDKHKGAVWEERSEEPISDMIEYVSRKDYFHFFCMAFTVQEDGYYTVHKMMRKAMRKFRTLR